MSHCNVGKPLRLSGLETIIAASLNSFNKRLNDLGVPACISDLREENRHLSTPRTPQRPICLADTTEPSKHTTTTTTTTTRTWKSIKQVFHSLPLPFVFFSYSLTGFHSVCVRRLETPQRPNILHGPEGGNRKYSLRICVSASLRMELSPTWTVMGDTPLWWQRADSDVYDITF